VCACVRVCVRVRVCACMHVCKRHCMYVYLCVSAFANERAQLCACVCESVSVYV